MTNWLYEVFSKIFGSTCSARTSLYEFHRFFGALSMIRLRALRYRENSQETHTVWKFEEGSVDACSFYYCSQDKAVQNDILSSFEYLFGGQAKKEFSDAAVQFIDQSQCIWTIERLGLEFRYHRNGKRLDPLGQEVSLLSAILDLDISSNSRNLDTVEVKNQKTFSSFEAEFNGSGQIELTFLSEEKKVQVKIFESCLNKELAIRMRLAGLVGLSDIDQTSCDQMFEKMHFLEICVDSFRELQTQFDLFQSQNLAPAEDEAYYKKIYSEVELLDRIYDSSKDLLDKPSFRKSLLLDISKHQDELNIAFKKFGITSIENLPSIEDWRALIEERAKLNGLRAFKNQIDVIENGIFEDTKSTFNDFSATLAELIASDSEITAELEKCLERLGSHLREIVPASSKGWQKYLEKFKRQTSKGQIKFKQIHRKNLLDNSKLAIDFALGRLGELHSDLDLLKLRETQWLSNAQKSFDDFSRLLRKREESWSQKAQSIGFDPDISLDKIFSLCGVSGSLVALLEMLKESQEALVKYDAKIENLSNLYDQWLEFSQSQKMRQQLEPSSLINQVKRLLSFREAKKNQLRSRESLLRQVKFQNDWQALWAKRREKIASEWSSLIQSFDFRIPDLANDLWKEIFTLLRSRAYWVAEMKGQGVSAVNLKQFFIDSENRPIVSALVFKNLNKYQRLDELAKIALSFSGGIAIALLDTTDFNEQARQLGWGKMIKVVPKQKPQSTTRHASDPLEVFRQARGISRS